MAPKFELPFTQPALVIAIVCALAVSVFLTTNGYSGGDSQSLWRIVPRLFHILAFSMWLGTQFWVSFIAGKLASCVLRVSILIFRAGITMYSNLPRHTFGYIQSKLFPKYFQIGTVLMTVVMCTFLWEHNQWDWKVKLQVISSRDFTVLL